MSIQSVLRKFKPPLSDTAIAEIAAEIEREVVAPLRAQIEASKSVARTSAKAARKH